MTCESVRWKAGGISVAGFSHVADGTPCQDANAFGIREDGWLVAAVSDGAGSAAHSHIGSRAYVSDVVEFFLNYSELPHISPDEMAASLIDIINRTSERLTAGEFNGTVSERLALSDFVATIVMVLCNQNGGTFFHVGDGAGVSLKLHNMEHCVVSEPENGEYLNETYFVTMNKWEEHLRVTSFCGEFDTILLMSDGVTPMAMNKGCEAPFQPFVQPVIEHLLRSTPDRGNAALRNTLKASEVRAITEDDMTLFWASSIKTEDT